MVPGKERRQRRGLDIGMGEGIPIWWPAVAEIGRLTGLHLAAQAGPAPAPGTLAVDMELLERTTAALDLPASAVDLALQGSLDPRLSTVALLARHAGAALVVAPRGIGLPAPRRGLTGGAIEAGADVAALQKQLAGARARRGLTLPSFALASGMPLGTAAAAETDPEAATLGGVARFAGALDLALGIVPTPVVPKVLKPLGGGRLGRRHDPDAGDATADLDWIRRALEEALSQSSLDAPTLARMVHLPDAVSRDSEACKFLGPFKTTATLAAGLGLALAVVDRGEREGALVRLGTSICSPIPPPSLSPAGAREAVRRQEKEVLETVRRRRERNGAAHADLAQACGTSERVARDMERGLMPQHVHRIARHAEALGLALVLRAA